MKTKLPDLAIGSYEAAAILRVHWTQPRRMISRKQIVGRKIARAGGRAEMYLYSLHDCLREWDEYQSAPPAANRPRTGDTELAKRVLAYLASGPQIVYEDATNCHAVARILGVHPSLITRFIARGTIVNRETFSERREGKAKTVVRIYSKADALRLKAERANRT